MRSCALILAIVFVGGLITPYYQPFDQAYPYSTGYFAHTSRIYYPTTYVTPARTGLPSPNYYSPGSYQNTWQWFRGYRSYTYAAYRSPLLLYT